MLLGLDHVGLATDDPDGAGVFLKLLGMVRESGGTADAYGVSCDFWQFSRAADEPAVELVAPARDESAIATWLGQKGPGLYHLAFEVDDLEADAKMLETNGFLPIDEEPCAGARPGMRVMFLYLAAPAEVLVELVQYDTPRRSPANSN